MGKFRYIFFCTLVLLLLFIVSSTDLILKEEKNTINNISVIFDETTDESYANFISGIDQGLKEWMADINYVSLYRHNDEEGQFDLILREVRDGADAVIVFPVNRRYLEEKLAENMINVPVLFAGTSTASEKVSGYICGDSYERGKVLAQAVLSREKAKKAYVFCDLSNMGETESMFLGLKESFQPAGITAVSLRYGSDEFLYDKLQEIRKEKETVVLIALDAGTLEKISGWPGYNNRFKIYGIGYSGEALSYLYDGKIQAANIVNEYGMGYLSLSMAMDILEQVERNHTIVLENMMIYKEDVYDSEYEKILFPIY